MKTLICLILFIHPLRTHFFMDRRRLIPIGVILIVLLGGGYIAAEYLGLITSEAPAEKTIVPEPKIEETMTAYGIELKDLYLCSDVIQPNDNLSAILSRNGVPFGLINEVVSKSQGVFDARKIRSGKSYCVLRSDSLDEARYFIYEQDPVNYVVYDFSESPQVYKGRKKVEEYRREASGVINSSLWQTLTENDISPQVAVELAKIYAWTIDFYRIHKGDQFKLIFSEKFVNGERIGMGPIEAGWFKHRNKVYYAIPFTDEDNDQDYYGFEGLSLRSAFLKAPLEFRRISSKFNRKRYHPILKRRRPHLGTDYAAATGTPVWSIGDGEIIKAKYSRGGGNNVTIRHNDTYTTKYLHLSKFAKGMKKGRRVSQGEVIGYVGSTGLATGPHLHFELIKNGKHVDSVQEDMPSGDPVSESCMESYMAYRDQMVEQLDKIQIQTASAEGAE